MYEATLKPRSFYRISKQSLPQCFPTLSKLFKDIQGKPRLTPFILPRIHFALHDYRAPPTQPTMNYDGRDTRT